MPFDIDEIVDVVITKETPIVLSTAFDTVLILGPNGNFISADRVYSNIPQVGEDFLTTDEEYLAASAIFKQSPRVQRIKIGKQSAKVAQIITVNFDINFVNLNSIAYKIDGVSQTPVVFDTDQAGTMADLAAAIQAHPNVATAQVTDTREITITAQTPGIPVSISGVIVTLGATQPIATIETITPNHGLVEDLIGIIHADNDWYALVITSRDKAEVELVADFIETQKKVFFACSDEAAIIDPDADDDILSILNLKNYKRSGVIYNGNPDDFADAAYWGMGLAYKPGELTWANKTLVGITPDNLTKTELTAALDKKANVYVTIGGVEMVRNGTMASGEYTDIVRDIDALQSRIAEAVFRLLVSKPKIHFTDAGVAIVLNIVKSELARGVDDGIIASYTDPTAPKVVNVSEQDKIDRILPDVNFTAIMTNAIHGVRSINGKLSL